jgi:hypothetical protein
MEEFKKIIQESDFPCEILDGLKIPDGKPEMWQRLYNIMIVVHNNAIQKALDTAKIERLWEEHWEWSTVDEELVDCGPCEVRINKETIKDLKL